MNSNNLGKELETALQNVTSYNTEPKPHSRTWYRRQKAIQAIKSTILEAIEKELELGKKFGDSRLAWDKGFVEDCIEVVKKVLK